MSILFVIQTYFTDLLNSVNAAVRIGVPFVAENICMREIQIKKPLAAEVFNVINQ
jgi:hypothetical protein